MTVSTVKCRTPRVSSRAVSSIEMGHQLSTGLPLEDLKCPGGMCWKVPGTLTPEPQRFGVEENKSLGHTTERKRLAT